MISVLQCPQPSCRLKRTLDEDELYCWDHHHSVLINVPMDIPVRHAAKQFHCIDCRIRVSSRHSTRCVSCNGIALRGDKRLRTPGQGITLEHGNAFDAPIARVN